MTLHHITYPRFPSHSLSLAVLEFTTMLSFTPPSTKIGGPQYSMSYFWTFFVYN
jgi:hypothetical protein